jgi:peptidoglycan/xylan/chitin deacetylase (PgdA/CDA1 family)
MILPKNFSVKNAVYLFIFILGIFLVFFFNYKIFKIEELSHRLHNRQNTVSPLLTSTIYPALESSPSATPTPKPLSFAEMNAKYGPCAQIPVLMYHHIQSEADAKKDGQSSLSVDPKFFQEQLQYLKDKNYSVITPQNIIDFFDQNMALPKKPVLITLDDAYEDNYFNAFPILKEFNFPAVIFTPTGLVNNPDYLNWDEINQMRGLVYFANHTWSHHSSSGTLDTLKKEISLADTQLNDHGLNVDKIFAYPYGNPSKNAESVLTSLSYKLAFTTTHGTILCKSQRFFLPRVRMGNAPLSSYGL